MPNVIQVKTILNKTKRRDPWFLDDYTVNPYSACSFNCLFCYIRGSKYGENLADKLAVKENAVALLDKQLALRAKKNQYGIIVMSSATDPYLQIEKEQQLTRKLLEVILKHRFPLHIITRSDLVVRDLDLLQQIREVAILPEDLASTLSEPLFITFSFSTTDNSIAHIFEPGATSPDKRLEALHSVSAAGFRTGVSLMPLLPYITDKGAHLEEMFQQFSTAGAQYIFPASLTLFGNETHDSKTLVLKAVEKHFPEVYSYYQKFFVEGSGVPGYYHKALAAKTKELAEKYGMRVKLF